jgi:hypothetical protein
MTPARAIQLLTLAGETLAHYLRAIKDEAPLPPGLSDYLDDRTHYFKLREFLQKANPVLETATPIISPLLLATGYGAPVSGLLTLATEAGRKLPEKQTSARLSYSSSVLLDGPFDVHYLTAKEEEIRRLKTEIERRTKEKVERSRRSQQLEQARTLERALSAAQVAAITSSLAEPEIEPIYIMAPPQPEASESEDVHYAFGKHKKKREKAKRAQQALEAEQQAEIDSLASQLRELEQGSQEEERLEREAEHARTLERVMSISRLGGSGSTAIDPMMYSPAVNPYAPASYGGGMNPALFSGMYDQQCCCRRDEYIGATSPRLLTGRPRTDLRPRTLFVFGGPKASFSARLADYRAHAIEHHLPFPESVLLDMLQNTVPVCCPNCHHDAIDCRCCRKDIVMDAAFLSRNGLPRGPFFSSSWVDATLDDMPDGTYGMVDTGRRPFKVTINRNVELPRAQVSFAHEMLHTMDDLLKLGLPHSQLHNAAVLLVSEVLPGLNALNQKAANQ